MPDDFDQAKSQLRESIIKRSGRGLMASDIADEAHRLFRAAHEAEVQALKNERDVYRAIIEAATLESVDAVSAVSMREKLCELRAKAAGAQSALAARTASLDACEQSLREAQAELQRLQESYRMLESAYLGQESALAAYRQRVVYEIRRALERANWSNGACIELRELAARLGLADELAQQEEGA